ncbi:chondroitinase-B domain-containing protein [Sphingobacterium chuzhouense]|uniref:Chloramphenicol resistance protein n=1 Tax=Sphingobacterium chuzhouense TaxID=1742264 RepID=A0ABR7XNX6_9SPHI|nr:chondroitinase-B domain-containing protein [Sphingobacterium chuzhouense]MBD1420870.1 chloramphenicol resistance protein [Sphingobacterium chuzhouense]
MKKTNYLFFFVMTVVWSMTTRASNIEVASKEEVYDKLTLLQPGDTLFLLDGIYKDIQLVVNNTGEQGKPIVIIAKNGGKVFFTGDAKVELRGQHLVLKDIYFKDGKRNPAEWQTHGPGLVAMYGSHNRITGCVFHAFDEANSAYITTTVPESGSVPKYCRIDHCVFTEKITFDQVINLNNRVKVDKKSNILGEAMYHRIDHCFFANPRKPGNAGGGIRIGYYRNDIGRCLVDSNLFVRQDSEPEIITGKSQENVYYANTFLNCQGTLNFRHGDKQMALNNFFISSDNKFEYGGMFVWGSQHLIANNYFNLKRTLRTRGNAALYFNPGPKDSEHALAFNTLVVNNIFDDNVGYDINFEPLLERRREFATASDLEFYLPYNIILMGNIFSNTQGEKHQVFLGNLDGNRLEQNFSMDIHNARQIGFKEVVRSENSQPYSPSAYQGYTVAQIPDIPNIEGVLINIQHVVNNGVVGRPLTWDDVRPEWLNDIPGSYAHTARLDEVTQRRFDRVIKDRK